jgi:tetratricopeptide (TPR) repeat protein
MKQENTDVSIWEERVTIPTYGTGRPNKNPMFFEKRIYQGSSGVVYPHPIVEKISDEKLDKEYLGLFIENQYLKIMILPELGGRIQMAYDKIKDRHFVYYNQVIKPALVGLTGPWISGGIEFNWPQHHRPTTFSPIDYKIESNADGSKTVWVNEVEQMFHTKGMAGFTLYPDRAYIEIKAKLYNRSELPQTFLWWANPAVKVNDHYQSVFPPDVNAVFDHGKRDVSSFPMATGTYYKVDYAPGTDISMYKNIPVPTSYMAINSDYDFVGGYEHDTRAGLLHVADHHISPGKKQWTWGNGDFGIAWDRNLTDQDGPYIELMTGMFTDNQPDFTWLMPNEEKSFTQYFLPYRDLGLVKNATKDILLSIDLLNKELELKIFVTSKQQQLKVHVICEQSLAIEEIINIAPEETFIKRYLTDLNFDAKKVVIIISDSKGKELLKFDPSNDRRNSMPLSAKPALPPEEIESNEQLFLTGQHLEQYRHATYSPVPYYEKALEREPGDLRNNNALGLWYLRRGQFVKSEIYFNAAITTSTLRNPNPYDSEPYYNLGLSLKFQGRFDEAYDAFYKSAWSSAWKDTGYFALTQIDLRRGHEHLAAEHVQESLDCNSKNSKAYVLKSAAFRKMNLLEATLEIISTGLKRDGFNLALWFESSLVYGVLGDAENVQRSLEELLKLSRQNPQNLIEYAIDYSAAGLFEEAIGFLKLAPENSNGNPMVNYHLGYLYLKAGQQEQALTHFKQANQADSYLCFPNRLEEINVLKAAIATNFSDAKAPYYLGNLFYDKRQYEEAISFWEQSSRLDEDFPTVWRNLGIAYFNKSNEERKALVCFEKAFSLDPEDDRLLMELHQLYKRLKYTPKERLAFLEKHMNLVLQRDDLYLELITLYNFQKAYDQALKLLSARHFHPWEGGEGKVSAQYVYSLTQLARTKINHGDFNEALELLNKAQTYPHNLGEGKLYGTQENDIFYWMGCAYEGLENLELANFYFSKATIGLDEPSAAMFYNDQQPDKIFYQGLSWIKLKEEQRATQIFKKLLNYGKEHFNDEVRVDYFAVSLPNLLIFEDDLVARNQVHCYFIEGLGYCGLGLKVEANEVFYKALALDPEHAGIEIHRSILNQDAGFQLSN